MIVRVGCIGLTLAAVIALSAQAQDDDKYCPKGGRRSCSTDGYLDVCVDMGSRMLWQYTGDVCMPKDVLSSSDAANADHQSEAALCSDAGASASRAKRPTCTLSAEQSFTLQPGPDVPESRRMRGETRIACMGGKAASFYPNGRIEGCVAAASGQFMDGKGRLLTIQKSDDIEFDPEGRVAVHQ